MSDSPPETPRKYVFRDQDNWKDEKLSGSVYNIPNDILNLKVEHLHAEWLSSYEEGDEEVRKNELRWRLALENPYLTEEGTSYDAVILYLKPNLKANKWDIVDGRHQSLVCGTDFIPAIFKLKMLHSSTPVPFTREYPIMAGLTVRCFIDPILDLGMDEFLFEFYTCFDIMKGCGHFAVRSYEVWLNKDLITSASSVEEPNYEFTQDVLRTFGPDNIDIAMRVGRGTFVRVEARAIDKDTEYVDGHSLWSGGLMRSHRVIAGHDVEAENQMARDAHLAVKEAQKAREA